MTGRSASNAPRRNLADTPSLESYPRLLMQANSPPLVPTEIANRRFRFLFREIDMVNAHPRMLLTDDLSNTHSLQSNPSETE
jgi:hypothetical protein